MALIFMEYTSSKHSLPTRIELWTKDWILSIFGHVMNLTFDDIWPWNFNTFWTHSLQVLLTYKKPHYWHIFRVIIPKLQFLPHLFMLWPWPSTFQARIFWHFPSSLLVLQNSYLEHFDGIMAPNFFVAYLVKLWPWHLIFEPQFIFGNTLY